MLAALFDFLQQSTLARLIDGSRYILMVIQGFHLLALVLLLGLALALNTRLQGLTLRLASVQEVARALQRPFWFTLAVTVVAGALLALPRLGTYSHNGPFLWKMGFLLVAALLQGILLRRSVQLPEYGAVPFTLRATSTCALLLWLGTGMAGRAIGFV
jgi:hypothetical protein